MLPPVLFDLIVELEGGDRVVHDPADPGGLTKWGISQRAFPGLDIANLSREAARQIYDDRYWAPIRGNSLPWPVAVIVFDAAVNQGVRAAIRCLQRAVGTQEDGVVGPATLRAVEALSASEAVERVAIERAHRYLALNNAVEERFERGWIARLIKVTRRAIEWKA